MTPSVRGRQKAGVAALLVASGATTAALVGFLAGVLWAATGLGPLPPAGLAALVVAAVALDAAQVPPPAVGTQVPRVWSELFAPPTVAVLYGARLGVGPLTILPTWLWWAAAVAGASLGPAWSAATGAAFAVTRLLVVVGVAEVARHAMARRMGRVRAGEPTARRVAAAAALAVAALPLLP